MQSMCLSVPTHDTWLTFHRALEPFRFEYHTSYRALMFKSSTLNGIRCFCINVVFWFSELIVGCLWIPCSQVTWGWICFRLPFLEACCSVTQRCLIELRVISHPRWIENLFVVAKFLWFCGCLFGRHHNDYVRTSTDTFWPSQNGGDGGYFQIIDSLNYPPCLHRFQLIHLWIVKVCHGTTTAPCSASCLMQMSWHQSSAAWQTRSNHSILIFGCQRKHLLVSSNWKTTKR